MAQPGQLLLSAAFSSSFYFPLLERVTVGQSHLQLLEWVTDVFSILNPSCGMFFVSNLLIRKL
jgi:hypothetical protein